MKHVKILFTAFLFSLLMVFPSFAFADFSNLAYKGQNENFVFMRIGSHYHVFFFAEASPRPVVSFPSKGDEYFYVTGDKPLGEGHNNYLYIFDFSSYDDAVSFLNTGDYSNSSLNKTSTSMIYKEEIGFSNYEIYLATANVYNYSTEEIIFVANTSWSGDIGDIGGSSESSGYIYDSSIPSPQNLQFKASAEGGIPIVHIGGTNYHTLSWTNTGLDGLAVRISVSVTAVDTENIEKSVDVMVCSDGSDGADVGYAASNKFFKYDFGTLDDLIRDSTGFGNHLTSWGAGKYRVQFYQYIDGVMHVGPAGVVMLKRNVFGTYSGTTVYTEVPVNSESLGSSGGLMPSDSDLWTSKDQNYIDYDSKGNVIDSGQVGSETPGSGSNNGFLGTIQDILAALVNIPTLIGTFFSSVRELFTGLGDFPSLLSSVFGFLPPEILTFIGLGVMLVVVLRIVGR